MCFFAPACLSWVPATTTETQSFASSPVQDNYDHLLRSIFSRAQSRRRACPTPARPPCPTPIRSRVEGEHPTGACLDVGGEGEWDRLFVGWPVVINHKKKEFRMYYHSLDPDSKTFRVGELWTNTV